MKCPKCGGEMDEGIVKPDGGYVGRQKWGKEVNWRGMVKDGLTVKTFKCKTCGYLESYAK